MYGTNPIEKQSTIPVQITMSRRLWERYQTVLEVAKKIKADIDFTADFEVWFGKQLDQVEPELQKHLSAPQDDGKGGELHG